jgi:hypothetical protein
MKAAKQVFKISFGALTVGYVTVARGEKNIDIEGALGFWCLDTFGEEKVPEGYSALKIFSAIEPASAKRTA